MECAGELLGSGIAGVLAGYLGTFLVVLYLGRVLWTSVMQGIGALVMGLYA